MVPFSRYTVYAVRGTEVAAVTTVYLALALWWLWPLPAVLATHSAYSASGPFAGSQVADWYLMVWELAWGAHALATDPTRLFYANAFYPASLSLAYSEHLLGHQPLFAPTYWASGNAVLAVNVAPWRSFQSSITRSRAFSCSRPESLSSAQMRMFV